MGVLNCDRHGCDNIMCDRYSYTYGYLCGECFDELEGSGKPVDVFMRSMKGTYNKRPPVYDYEDEFPIRR